jgi:peptide/nickel transport system permease protein
VISIRKYDIATWWPVYGIVAVIIMALTSQLWVVDNTQNSNRQAPQVALLKGGEVVRYIRLNNDEWIPILSHRREGNALYYIPRLSGGVSGQEERILSEVTGNEKKTLDRSDVVSVRHWLGTDVLGRDILSRLMYGVRLSLLIGFLAILVSAVIGTSVGLLSGFLGGWLDKVTLTFINSLWSIPTILLVFAFVLAIGRGLGNIVLAIGLTMWVDMARLVRGLTMQLRETEYIGATRALGYPDLRILSRHILPNVVDPMIVLATVNFATAILVEAGISYLGFGIAPPKPSVGQILSENYGYAIGGHWMKSVMPALTICVMVLLLNLSGNNLRDHLDVKLAKKGQ